MLLFKLKLQIDYVLMILAKIITTDLKLYTVCQFGNELNNFVFQGEIFLSFIQIFNPYKL